MQGAGSVEPKKAARRRTPGSEQTRPIVIVLSPNKRSCIWKSQWPGRETIPGLGKQGLSKARQAEQDLANLFD
jgi:hypothetical protein